MPSIEAPTYYDRSKGLAPGRQDVFFKHLSPDDGLADTGSVESPYGHLMLVKVDSDLLIEVRARIGYAVPYDAEPDKGWYIVRSDDNGLVWGIWYGPLDSVWNEEQARADFLEADCAFCDWMSDIEG